MVTFRLVVFPGGFEDLKSVPDGTTLAEVQEQFGLQDRSMTLNGRQLPGDQLATTRVSCHDTVAALQPSKGNI